MIPWGAGGATDNVMRSLTPYVEKELGGKFILNNRPGGTAVIGSTYVMQQRPDGYTILLGAENPQLYPVLKLATFDYSDFYPINIIGQNVVVIAAPADAPFSTMAELLAAAKANPDTLRMGTTGAGGLPSTVHAMINAVDELKVREVTFGGDGPGITALMGKQLSRHASLAGVQQQDDSQPGLAFGGIGDERHDRGGQRANAPPDPQVEPKALARLCTCVAHEGL